MAKNIDPNKPLFGETAYVGGREAKWEPGYKEARAAAIELCKHFPALDPERDFWIKMESARYDNLIHFQAIVIRLAGCQKINENMPRAYQFDPASVETLFCNGQRAAFAYKNAAQGVFTTGEANEANCNVSYVCSTAEKRVFCRAVLQLVFKMLGINGQSIYSEVEAEEFKEHECGGKRFKDPSEEASVGDECGAPAPVIMQDMDEPEADDEDIGTFNSETDEGLPAAMTEPDDSVIGFDDPAFGADPRQQKLDDIAKLMESTKTIEKNVCEYYEKKNGAPAGSYKSVADLADNDLEELTATLHKKEEKLAKEKTDADTMAFAQKVVDASRKIGDANPSPAPSIEPEPAPTLLDEAFEDEDDGPAVFTCNMTAPAELLDLVGKTLDEIGSDTLSSLFGRKNSKARKHIDPVMEAEIDMFLMTAKKSKKEA